MGFFVILCFLWLFLWVSTRVWWIWKANSAGFPQVVVDHLPRVFCVSSGKSLASARVLLSPEKKKIEMAPEKPAGFSLFVPSTDLFLE